MWNISSSIMTVSSSGVKEIHQQQQLGYRIFLLTLTLAHLHNRVIISQAKCALDLGPLTLSSTSILLTQLPTYDLDFLILSFEYVLFI